MFKGLLLFRVRNIWPLLLFCTLALLMLAACGEDDDAASSGDDGIVITGAWARPAVLLDGDEEMDHEGMEGTAEEGAMDHDGMDMGGTNGAVYMTIENRTDEDDRLVAAETDIAGAVELHTVNMAEGVMQMREVEDGIEVPAGGSEVVVLEPGGLHAMLIDLNQALEVGDTFAVDLEFESAGTITVEVEVREP